MYQVLRESFEHSVASAHAQGTIIMRNERCPECSRTISDPSVLSARLSCGGPVIKRRNGEPYKGERIDMRTTQDQKALAEYLRTVQPHLICRVEPERVSPEAGQFFKINHCTAEVETGWDQVLSPVYWRFVTRGAEQLYCSTFVLTRDLVLKGWGTSALVYCDPITGTAAVRIETILADLDSDA
jgi:hypothetical protein